MVRISVVTVCCLLAGALEVMGQDPGSKQDEIQQLKKELEALKKKVEAMEDAGKVKKDVDELKKKVSEQESKKSDTEKMLEHLSKMHFHGYGEVHYNNPKTGVMSHRTENELDVHRFVLGWGYEFTDSIRFDTEIDFEHAAEEIELEYLHVDFDVLPSLTVRAGSLLMPVGPMNEFHEPPLFYSVERPYVMNSIVPTTWQENGVGVVGRVFDGALAYRAYVTGGLDGSQFTTMDGLRKGRSKGVTSKADDLAVVGRVEYGPLPKLNLGSSFYVGEVDQELSSVGGDALVKLFEGDARYQVAGFDLRAVVVDIRLDHADRLSTSSKTIGKEMLGWYVEAAYNVLPLVFPEAKERVMIFGRREEFDTNKKVPSGFTGSDAADREVWTVGVAYYPIDKIVIKADFEMWENDEDPEDKLNRFNLGLGFIY